MPLFLGAFSFFSKRFIAVFYNFVETFQGNKRRLVNG